MHAYRIDRWRSDEAHMRDVMRAAFESHFTRGTRPGRYNIIIRRARRTFIYLYIGSSNAINYHYFSVEGLALSISKAYIFLLGRRRAMQ